MTKKLYDIEAGSPAWEEICERCGRCCYEKYEYRDKIFYTRTPCQYLDLKTKACTVYHDRSKRHPECVSLTLEFVEAGILPDDCPYVKLLRDSEPSSGE